jgi:hypothetical protein
MPAFLSFFLGLYHHGVATTSARPVGTLFAMHLRYEDKRVVDDMDVRISTLRDFDYSQRSEWEKLPEEHVGWLDGYDYDGLRLYARMQWASRLPEELLRDNVFLFGSLYLYFEATSSPPPDKASIAGLEMWKSESGTQHRDYVVYKVNLRKNPLFFGHCVSPTRDGRSRSRDMPPMKVVRSMKLKAMKPAMKGKTMKPKLGASRRWAGRLERDQPYSA